MTGRPTILVVFPYEHEYGPFRTLRFILKGIQSAGYDPVCVLPPSPRLVARLSELGIETHTLPRLGTVPRTLNPVRLGVFLSEHLAVTEEIQAIASARDARLIYSLSEAVICGSLAATRLGIPSIVHVIGLSIGSPSWTASLYIRILERLTTHFVGCSAAVSEMLEDHGVPEPHISVVHSGVSISEIDATVGTLPDTSEAGAKIGMVAAYDPRKGHELFVEAAAKLALASPDARFYIIGGVFQGQRESIEFDRYITDLTEKRGLGSRVVRVGHVPPDEVYRWIRGLDVFVLPSRTEAFGYVQFEAMACRRPVIATRIEGNLDAFIDGESGIYVDQVAEDVAAAAAKILADPKLAESLGRAARERVTRFFDEQLLIPVLADVIEATVSQPVDRKRADEITPLLAGR